MDSVWTETTALPVFEPLRGDLKTDVLIIGGGMAGILCAYQLAQAGVDYILVEAGNICGRTTGNTTAKITSQHGLIYDRILHSFGREKAEQYYQSNQDALARYRTICAGIDCDFEEKTSYVYSLEDRHKLEAELDALRRIGCRNAGFTENVPLPLRTVGAVHIRGQAQFHPLKFVKSLASGLRIYENTAIREWDGTQAVTEYGKIRANRIVCATHFPMFNKHGGFFLKLYQQRSYVLGLESAQDVDGMYVDESGDGLSFRNYRNLLLLGGGGHRTGKTGGGWRELKRVAEQCYPESNIRFRWATQDCMSLDGIPYIGRYTKKAANFYVATGFNKWGMTTSMVAAMLLCDMITGKKNPYEPLYSPSRSILRPQLAVNAAEAVTNLLTISEKRCPHLGCALKWNPQERSWDCPCHGSRFAEDGTCLDNPANGDLNQEKKG